jgi:uncharacterized protein YwqG
MRISEQLFDLGPAGILALTLDSSSAWRPPYPAQRYGRARLHVGGQVHDLIEVCTRPVARDMLDLVIKEARARMAGAVAAVRDQIDWAERHASDDFREAPAQAWPMGYGLMLLGFTGAVQPRIFRVVDVMRGLTLWESTVEDVQRDCGIRDRHETTLMGGDNQLVNATGGRHAVIWMQLASAVLGWTGSALRCVSWRSHPRDLLEFYGTKDHLVLQPDRDRNEYQVIVAETGAEVARFAAPTQSKGWTRPVTSPGCERIVLPHEGGTVDIVDEFGASHFAIRPYPRVGRNDSFGCRLSFDGGFLVTRQLQSSRVVDLDRRLVAEAWTPAPLLSDDPSNVIYDSDVLASDLGVSVVYDGRVIFHPHGSLSWEPVIEPGKRASPKTSLEPPEYEKHLARWAKPALSITPTTHNGGRSRLYGVADMPEAEIPRHEGSPMTLLAQIGLAEVAEMLPENPWPKEGTLCFFCAVDDEGSALVDKMFNPKAIKVIWNRRDFAPAKGGAAMAPQPVTLSVHEANLPDITAVIVEAEGLDDEALEAYRVLLEKREIAEQPSGHRLGGYATILQNNDLEAQAAHFAEEVEYPPRDLEGLRAAARWRLLLQLDSDDYFMWGTDSGTLYFLIHDDDLAKQDFSRVIAVCEGY